MKIECNGPLRHNSVNPRYFADNSGQGVYLTGSHTWAVMTDMWPADEPRHTMDFNGFLQMMEDNGHNFLRFWQFALMTRGCPWNDVDTLFDPMPFQRTGPGLANDGEPKFDLNRFNEDYFHKLRSRIKDCERHGIYASIMMFEGWSLKNEDDRQPTWRCHVFNPDNNINGITDNPLWANGRHWGVFSLDCPQILEAQKAFVRKVVDTVNDCDNVLYEICNETPYTPEAMEWQTYMCAYIRDYEKTKPKQHMIGITPEGGIHSNREMMATNADWISPASGDAGEYRYNPPAADGKKVILNDTDHLWGHGCSTAWVWKSFTRGHNVLFMDPWEPIPGELDWWLDGDISRNQRYYYAFGPVRSNLGYARDIALSFDLNCCVPDLSFCTSTYCLANPNAQYVCYFPEGDTEGLNLTGLNGVFHISWLEPKTGKTYQGTSIDVDALAVKRAFLTVPFPGPGVLLFYKDRKTIRKHRSIYTNQ